MTNEEIQKIFFVECEEALAAAEIGLMSCRSGHADTETLNGVFRAVHSIKGGAGAFAFTALQAFTHSFETVLGFLRDGEIAPDEHVVTTMLQAFDLLSDHVAAARGEAEIPDDAAILAALDAISATAGASEGAADCAQTAAAADAAPAAASAPAGDGLDFDLDNLLADIGAPTAAPDWSVEVRPRDEALGNGSEPLLLLRELVRLGGTCVQVTTLDAPELDHFDADRAFLAWTFRVPGTVEREAIADIFDFIGDEVELAITPIEPQAVPVAAASAPVAAPPMPAPAASLPPVAVMPATPPPTAPAPEVPKAGDRPAPESVAASRPAEEKQAAAAPPPGQSIRIELNKLDRLIDTVGELVIAQAMLAQRLSSIDAASFEELTLLDGLTRDIQESAMAIRAQPIQSVFSRVPRMLRELESSTGKRIRLEMAGESTELDKTVLERLGEPLTHLIRNAVDHGIELPEDRVAAGKPAEGVLRLSAEQRSGRILIRVGDDGRGIDRERVLAKAIDRGLVAPDAQLTTEEIDQLIFAPGFSTAAALTSISGRGVGMDVVRQNVKDLGGRISIESEKGAGSTFTLALPLTLAISDGMIVTVGDQTLVVPLTHVVESLSPRDQDVAMMGVDRRMLNVRGQFIPILPLSHAASANGAIEAAEDSVLIVVETESAGQAALQVDTICDQRQFVIKSLDSNYRAVPGIAGATILGDGKVALIVDVDGIVAELVGLRDQTIRQAA